MATTSSAEVEAKILFHPIPKMDGEGDNNAGRLHVYGNPKTATHLIIMSAGYPDNQKAFAPMAKWLVATGGGGSGGCLVGITCPPGYDDDDALDLTAYPKDGFTFDDWVAHLREAVKALRQYSQKAVEQSTLTGIFHDWGVIMGAMYTNRVAEEQDHDSLGLKLDRVIIYDVLMPPNRQCKDWDRSKRFDNKTLWNKCSQMCYQVFLAGAFVLQRYLPSSLVLPYYMCGSAILGTLGMFPVNPSDKEYIQETLNITQMKELRRIWYMAYPYFQLWKLIFAGQIRGLLKYFCLPRDLSQTPVLYLYGASKPYDLSDANGVELLKQQEEKADGRHSKVVKVENAGHWLYIQQPDICHNAMQEFFQATIPGKKD